MDLDVSTRYCLVASLGCSFCHSLSLTPFGAPFGQARHKLDGNMYAVKRLCVRRGGHRNLEEEEKILREVSTLARLSHAHVVRYYQAWMESGSIVDLQESEDDGVDDDSWEEESEKVPTASGLDRCQDCRQEYRPWTAHLFDLPLQPPDSSLCQDCYQQQMTATGHTDVCSLLQFSEAQTDAVLTLPHFLYIQMVFFFKKQMGLFFSGSLTVPPSLTHLFCLHHYICRSTVC